MDKRYPDTIRAMLLLLKASLRGETPALETPVDWSRLFSIARQHGVVTFVYDAIAKLPPRWQPQGDIALSWTLSAERTRERYREQWQVLQHLAQASTQARLPMLVVKGVDLAQLYPVPDSRACGDIDVFFFDRYHEGNAFLGNPEAPLDGKHASHLVDGVEVENHRTFLDQNSRRQRRAEQYIQSTLPQARCDSMGVYHLSPMGNMVYLLMHTVSHLTAKYKLPLRNVLDWGVFLHSYAYQLPPIQCRAAVRSIGMTDAFNLLTYCAGEMLGYDFHRYLSGFWWRKDIGRMHKLVLQKDYLPHVPDNLPFWTQLKLRAHRWWHRHWLYHYLPYTPAERLHNVAAKELHALPHVG